MNLMNRIFPFKYRPIPLRRTITICVIFFLFSLSSQAQNKGSGTGKISGRIIDSLTTCPIEFATISLFTQSDNKVINGVMTDSNGVFKIIKVLDGTYKIVVEFIGYSKTTKKNIIISKKSTTINLGDITLSSKHTAIDEVTVIGDKSLVENKIDKMVYNADQDISSQSGVAADVLKKVPQVSVDVDGNVELQGNSNIRFLIDGKPSILYGNNIADVLQSIPANQIQRIDVITSPGAKYEAEGTGGIINIILKKSDVHGVNGNVSLSAGTRLENGSLNMNLRKGSLGVNAFLSGNAQLKSSTINTMNRRTNDSTTTSHLLQTGKSNFSRNGYQSGIGFNWDATPKDNITAALGYNFLSNNNDGSVHRETLTQDLWGNQLSNVTDSTRKINTNRQYSYNYNLGYKRKFAKEDQELEVLFNSTYGDIYSYYEHSQLDELTNAVSNSSHGKNPGIQKETNIEINYSQPIIENLSFETGGKVVMDNIKSNSNVYLLIPSTSNYVFNESQSSSVDYNRTVYAVYLSATFKLLKALDLKTGLRDEYTDSKATFSNVGIVNIKPYNTLVPSAVISHTFKKKQTLKLSYAHRIERPDYKDLNPFINASDPKNLSAGNANLRPEIGDKVELSYSQSFKNGANINPSIFYRGNRDDIQAYTTYYPTYKIGDSTYSNVAFSTRENIGREDNYGISLFASLPVTKKINIRTNISCYERFINTGMVTGGNIHGFNYRANLNVSYQITSTFIIELLGNFNSPRINAQGTMPSFTTYNVALRKQFFHKKASLAITATNFLNKYTNQETELTGQNFSLVNTRQIPYRSFGFNFTYKFGKLAFGKEKDIEDVNLRNPQDN